MQFRPNINEIAVTVANVLPVNGSACVAHVAKGLILRHSVASKLAGHADAQAVKATIGNQIPEPVALQKLLEVGGHVSGVARLSESVGAPLFLQVQQHGPNLRVNRNRQFLSPLGRKRDFVVFKVNGRHRQPCLGNAAAVVSGDGERHPVKLGVLPGFTVSRSGNGIQGIGGIFGLQLFGRQSLDAEARGRVGIDVATQDSFVKDNGQHAKLGVGGISGNVFAPHEVLVNRGAGDSISLFDTALRKVGFQLRPRIAVLQGSESISEPRNYPGLYPTETIRGAYGHRLYHAPSAFCSEGLLRLEIDAAGGRRQDIILDLRAPGSKIQTLPRRPDGACNGFAAASEFFTTWTGEAACLRGRGCKRGLNAGLKSSSVRQESGERTGDSWRRSSPNRQAKSQLAVTAGETASEFPAVPVLAEPLKTRTGARLAWNNCGEAQSQHKTDTAIAAAGSSLKANCLRASVGTAGTATQCQRFNDSVN